MVATNCQGEPSFGSAWVKVPRDSTWTDAPPPRLAPQGWDRTTFRSRPALELLGEWRCVPGADSCAATNDRGACDARLPGRRLTPASQSGMDNSGAGQHR